MNPLFGFFEGALSPSHILVVIIVGVLLFGERLPEMGRSLGKGLLEFKKGLNGLEEELETATTPQPLAAEQTRPPQRSASTPPGAEGHAATILPPKA